MRRVSSIISISRLALLAALLAFEPLGAAKPPGASDAADCEGSAACRALLQQGIGEFKENRYEAALNYFRKAYSYAPDPRLLVFQGRSQFKLGNPQGALLLYQRAQTGITSGPDLVKLEQYIKDARAALPVPPDQDAAARLAAEQREAEKKKEKKTKPWVWALIGVAAAGVVGTAVGVGVYYGTSVPAPDATIRFP